MPALLVGLAAMAESVTPTGRVTRFVLVREGPSASSSPVAQLKPADAAESIESARRWLKVRLPSGSEGYVSKAWVAPSEPRDSTETAKAGPPILYPDPAMTPGVTNTDYYAIEYRPDHLQLDLVHKVDPTTSELYEPAEAETTGRIRGHDS